MDFSEEFTIDEKEAILRLRQKLTNEEEYKNDILYDDLILFKFLKGCSFQLNQAEQMLKKHIKWRKIYQVDRILQDYKPLEVLDLYLPQSFLGFDKEGCVIRYNPTGNTDSDGIFKSASLQDFLRCIVHLIETDINRTKEQSRKLGKNISQFVYIYNLENLTIAKAFNKRNLDTMMTAATLLQDNYPERLKSVYVINAPSFFTLSFAILKSVISSGLLKKIKVFGQYGWKEALLEIIDEDVLPAFMGGKRTDPDGNPLCNTTVNHGCKVPEKYYLCNRRKDFKTRKNIRKISIKKQRKEEINVFVENEGSFIEWEFESKPKDIAFGLYFEQKMENMYKKIELIPDHKIETIDFPETGKYYCEKSGKYIIIFDNSYSFWTDKEVFFKISINSEK